MLRKAVKERKRGVAEYPRMQFPHAHETTENVTMDNPNPAHPLSLCVHSDRAIIGSTCIVVWQPVLTCFPSAFFCKKGIKENVPGHRALRKTFGLLGAQTTLVANESCTAGITPCPRPLPFPCRALWVQYVWQYCMAVCSTGTRLVVGELPCAWEIKHPIPDCSWRSKAQRPSLQSPDRLLSPW